MTYQNSAQQQLESAKQTLDASFEGYKNKLIELAKIPGIAWEAFDAADLERSAN
ncbi:MAG: hypothetical protein RL570_285, partial [Actinomycetota bacterium]